MTDDWHTEDFPELRPHPPWVMQEMIEAEPALLEQIATTSDTAPLALLLKVSGPLTWSAAAPASTRRWLRPRS